MDPEEYLEELKRIKRYEQMQKLKTKRKKKTKGGASILPTTAALVAGILAGPPGWAALGIAGGIKEIRRILAQKKKEKELTAAEVKTILGQITSDPSAKPTPKPKYPSPPPPKGNFYFDFYDPDMDDIEDTVVPEKKQPQTTNFGRAVPDFYYNR